MYANVYAYSSVYLGAIRVDYDHVLTDIPIVIASKYALRLERIDEEISRAYSLMFQISGYLNLVANSIDNFTHGLAVGGGFLISTQTGLMTTFAILGKCRNSQSDWTVQA